MVTYGDYAYLCEHWVVYRFFKSAFCTSETNITLYVDYTFVINFKSKQICRLIRKVDVNIYLWITWLSKKEKT